MRNIGLAATIAVLLAAPAFADDWSNINLPYDVPSCPSSTGQDFPSCTAMPASDARLFSFSPSQGTEFVIPLADFATAASVHATQSQFGALQAEFGALQSQIAAFQLSALTADKIQMRGISMAMAMSGIGDLSSDEHFALAGNVGLFHGQTSFSAGFAARATQNLSFNAAIAVAPSGSDVGARAGFRVAW
jgi:hypothetical protein